MGNEAVQEITRHSRLSGGFPGGSVVKNPPARQKMQVPPLDWEDALEEEMATLSSSLA